MLLFLTILPLIRDHCLPLLRAFLGTYRGRLPRGVAKHPAWQEVEAFGICGKTRRTRGRAKAHRPRPA